MAELARIAARPGANDKSRASVLLANAEEEQTLTFTHVLWAMFGVLPASVRRCGRRAGRGGGARGRTVEVEDPRTFGALVAPIVGCTPDYLEMKRIEGHTGVDGIEYTVNSAPGVVFTVDPSAMPANTLVNIILYTIGGREGGYYIAVGKPTDNACTLMRIRTL